MAPPNVSLALGVDLCGISHRCMTRCDTDRICRPRHSALVGQHHQPYLCKHCVYEHHTTSCHALL